MTIIGHHLYNAERLVERLPFGSESRRALSVAIYWFKTSSDTTRLTIADEMVTLASTSLTDDTAFDALGGIDVWRATCARVLTIEQNS